MKKTILFILTLFFVFSCKAQTILPLDGPPIDIANLEKPIYGKDINMIRDQFYGIWQGFSGNSEIIINIYKIDDVPNGILGNSNESFIDEIFGYYIYKENGVVVLDSRNEAQLHNTPQTVKLAPLYGITDDGASINQLFFIDYGIQIQNIDASYGPKSGIASLIISNPLETQLEATFHLKNRPDAGTVIITNGQTIEPYNYDFSIPTDITLTKISNTPPPL